MLGRLGWLMFGYVSMSVPCYENGYSEVMKPILILYYIIIYIMIVTLNLAL